MNEEQLANLIRKTVLEWAMEEYLSNQDSESNLTLKERFEENAHSFIQLIGSELDKDYKRIEELPL